MDADRVEAAARLADPEAVPQRAAAGGAVVAHRVEVERAEVGCHALELPLADLDAS